MRNTSIKRLKHITNTASSIIQNKVIFQSWIGAG